eukprot:396030-Amphidinium_carterae.3
MECLVRMVNGNIRFLYANITAWHSRYASALSLAENENADVVMLVETHLTHNHIKSAVRECHEHGYTSIHWPLPWWSVLVKSAYLSGNLGSFSAAL